LFHTGRFRRIESYAVLSATTCVARIAPAGSARWFPCRDADDLLLGDPAVRDAALHALQACVPHRRVLPIAARRIQLGVLRPDRAYTVHGKETAREADNFVFDVEIRDVTGDLAERWEGLTLRAIEALPAPMPWPVALAAVYAERRLSELLPASAVRVALAEDADGTPPPSDRLLTALLPPGDAPRRRPDGRPEAADAVSAAHAGPLTLAVAGGTETGCDLEPLTERSEFFWRGVLGPERLNLAQLIARETRETLSQAATRVWTTVEALKKAGADVVHAPIVLDRVESDLVLLSSSCFVVPSWVGELKQGAFVLAVAAHFGPTEVVRPLARSSARAAASQAWSYRHVVGFGDTNLVGNVYFVNHLEWQGRCREMFLRDKAPTVVADLANGLALLTVRCSCEYLAELTAFDEVRLDMRLDRIVANRIAFRFDYWRCGGDADELVAVGEQEVACLRAVGTGKLPTEIPAALLEALSPYRSN
jgi:acyl-CoA thioesterase FadM